MSETVSADQGLHKENLVALLIRTTNKALWVYRYVKEPFTKVYHVLLKITAVYGLGRDR